MAHEGLLAGARAQLTALQLFAAHRLDHFAVGQRHGVHAHPFGHQFNQPKPVGVGLKING